MKPEDWTPNTVDAIATSTADGRRLIIKAVNYDGTAHTLLTRLQGSGVPASATVNLVTLTAALDEANSLAEPDRLRRVETMKPYTRDMAFELPPYTVAVIEIQAN
jgi:alpha-N-arabinofuranosidase